MRGAATPIAASALATLSLGFLYACFASPNTFDVMGTDTGTCTMSLHFSDGTTYKQSFQY